ncbi:MAG: hypothetical protein WBG30_03125 [Psychrilyobacter sp.]|uniref:hypothetical protein n=1 Tax=Psychrilyobacter sp. TaxID=2586924 RepID=UPI003C70F93B
MINKLNKIKELRKANKLIAEEKLRRLKNDYKIENKNEKIAQRIEDMKKEIKKLEKDLKNLADLEKKFKQE